MDILLGLGILLAFCQGVATGKLSETFEKFYTTDARYSMTKGEQYQHTGMGISTLSKFSILSNTPTLFKVKRPGLNNDVNTVSLESLQKPEFYLRYKNYKFHMEKDDGTDMFRKDATLRERLGPRGRAYELLGRDNWFMCHTDNTPFTLKAQAERIGTQDFVNNCVYVPVKQDMVEKKNIVKSFPSGGAMVVNHVPSTQDTDKCISIRFVNHLGGPVRVVSSLKPEGYLVTANAFKLKTIFKHANHKQRHVIFYAENVQDRDDDVMLNDKNVFTVKPHECVEDFKNVVLSSQPNGQPAKTDGAITNANNAQTTLPSNKAPATSAQAASPSVNAPATASQTTSPSVNAPATASQTTSPSVNAPATASQTTSPSVNAPVPSAQAASPSVNAPATASQTTSPSVNAPTTLSMKGAPQKTLNPDIKLKHLPSMADSAPIILSENDVRPKSPPISNSKRPTKVNDAAAKTTGTSNTQAKPQEPSSTYTAPAMFNDAATTTSENVGQLNSQNLNINKPATGFGAPKLKYHAIPQTNPAVMASANQVPVLYPNQMSYTAPLQQQIQNLDSVLQKRIQTQPGRPIFGNAATRPRTQTGNGYEQWSSYGPCSVTCGVGMRRRTRVCRPGSYCYGPAAESRACLKEQCASNCIHTTGGSVKAGSCCHFPFSYNGAQYYHCILSQKNNERMWCAVTPYYERDKQWGYCPRSAKAPQRSLIKPVKPVTPEELFPQTETQSSSYNTEYYNNPYMTSGGTRVPCSPMCTRVCEDSCPKHCCLSARADLPVTAYMGNNYGRNDKRSNVFSYATRRYRRSVKKNRQ